MSIEVAVNRPIGVRTMSSGPVWSFAHRREGNSCRWRQCQSTVAAFSNRGTTGRDCWRGERGVIMVCTDGCSFAFIMINLARLVHFADELWESGMTRKQS